MTNKFLIALTVVVPLALIAPKQPASAAESGSALGPSPTLGGGSYSSGGGLTVALELRNLGGVTGICGVWAESTKLNAFTRGKASRVLASGSVFLGKSKLYQGLHKLRKTAPSDSFAGAPTKCLRSKRPWNSGDENLRPDIRIPNQVVYQSKGGGDKVLITFKGGGPGAHIAHAKLKAKRCDACKSTGQSAIKRGEF